MIGVDYELFWTLNPKSLSPFIKAFSLQQKYDDTMAWQHGMYIRMAIASVMDKNSKYPVKPLMYDSKSREIVSKQEEIKNKFLNQMEILNMRFRKEV